MAKTGVSVPPLSGKGQELLGEVVKRPAWRIWEKDYHPTIPARFPPTFVDKDKVVDADDRTN